MQEKHLLFQSHKFITYAAPPVLAVLATIVKIWLFRYTGYSIPFLLYFLAALLAGAISGSRGVMFALLAIAVCTFVWLIPVTDGVGRYTLAELVLFLAEGIAVALLFWLNERTVHDLDESEKKYRRIIDQNAEALLLCDQPGHITYASSAALRLLHRNNTELAEKPLQDYIHQEEQSQFNLTMLRLQIQGEGTGLLRLRIFCGNGEWRWAECSINNLLNDRLVAAMVMQLRDITHRVNQERHQEDFVNMASHELKSPITAIRGFLQIANKRWKEGKLDNHEQYLGRIQAQTDKLLILIDDMLNMTRIKAGELAYHFERTDVAACLQEAAEAVKAATPARVVDLDIQPNLPVIEADKARIGQVITNLLNNALKYSPTDAPVKAALYQKDEWLEVTVSDQGIGIPSDRVRRVFDRFYRVDTLPKGKFEGLGLGLFIAAEIVRKHHGHIWVDSEENKGSVFHFSLPLE